MWLCVLTIYRRAHLYTHICTQDKSPLEVAEAAGPVAPDGSRAARAATAVGAYVLELVAIGLDAQEKV